MGDLINNNMFRTRMVAQPEGSKSYLSLADAVRKLKAEGGISAFYKGTYLAGTETVIKRDHKRWMTSF
jgi:hypothetical protein